MQPSQAGSPEGSNDEQWDRPLRSPQENRNGSSDELRIDLSGFSGPLDLLLALARTHKLDLSKLSIAALVDQYLDFIEAAQRLRLEVAADYLVMAAWLAFLKSRLLLPKVEQEKDAALEGEDLARHLAFRLQRLEAMRQSYERLLRRPRLGHDVFPRGSKDQTRVVRETRYGAELYDLLKAYADQRKRGLTSKHVVRSRPVWSVKDARPRLEALLNGEGPVWVQLDMFVDQYAPSPDQSRTAFASGFSASLEMVREGLMEIRQERPFGPILMRRRAGSDKGAPDGASDP